MLHLLAAGFGPSQPQLPRRALAALKGKSGSIVLGQRLAGHDPKRT